MHLVLTNFRTNNTLMTGSEIEPSIPPPPSLPPTKKAPWINIESSILSQEWKKLINDQQFSDVCFHLSHKSYFAHRYILASSSDVMRAMFDIKVSKPVDSLSDRPLWSHSRLKNFSTDRINDGKEDGFISVVFDNQ